MEPIHIVALVTSGVALLIHIIAMATPYWASGAGFYFGLFQYCINSPFGSSACASITVSGSLGGVQACIVLAFLANAAAIALLAAVTFVKNLPVPAKFLKHAGWVLLLSAALLNLIGVVVFIVDYLEGTFELVDWSVYIAFVALVKQFVAMGVATRVTVSDAVSPA